MNFPLASGSAEMIGEEALAVRLSSGAKLRVKLGIDPTAPDLHLGHAIVLKKLREFQDAGHQAVLVIGDFTAMIGDPSGRAGAREPLTKEAVEANLSQFLEQACRILDRKTLEVRRNSEWFGKFLLADTLSLMGRVTLQQLSQREDFAKRLADEKPVGFHELMYPLLQAHDSVVLDADIELGGMDQRLNLIAGRHLMEKMGKPAQAIMMMPLLVGLDGERKMSKSLGNYIGITDAPDDMFGKTMSIPDALMPSWFLLLTDVEMPLRSDSGQAMKPRDAKALLARTIVTRFHGAEAGRSAEEAFVRAFSKKEMPENADELGIRNDELGIIELLILAGVKSKGEAKRLIEQGGVKLDGESLKDADAKITIRSGMILQIGKLKAFRLVK